MKRVYKLGISIGLIAVAVVILVVFAPVKTVHKAEETAKPIPVDTVIVKRATMEDALYANGTIYPRKEAKISPKMPGKIEKMFADEGYRVTEKGDVLDKAGKVVSNNFIVAELDKAQLTLNKQRAEQALLQARAGKATSEAAILQAQAGVEQTKAGIRQAHAGVEQANAGVDQAAAGIKQADAAIAQAEANLKNVKADFERINNLYEKKAASKQNLDHISAGLEAAKAALTMANERKKVALSALGQARESLAVAEAGFMQAEEQQKVAEAAVTQANYQKAAAEAMVQQAKIGVEMAQTHLDDANIIAPIAGTIVTKTKNLGEEAVPGKPVYKLEYLDTVELKVEVSSLYLNRLKNGVELELKVDGIPDPIPAAISEISPVVDKRSRSVEITARLDNKDRRLRPGLFSHVKVVLEKHENVSVIPYELVFVRDGRSYVFRVKKDSTVEKVEITPGIRQGNLVEIVDGLNIGDRIAGVGRDQLSGGEKVVVAQKEGEGE